MVHAIQDQWAIAVAVIVLIMVVGWLLKTRRTQR